MELVTAETECERRKIHYWAQQGRICHVRPHSLPAAHFAPFLRSSPVGFSLDIPSVSSRHGRMQPRFLITCVFFLFFVALLLQVLRIRCLSWMSRLPLVQLHVEIGLWLCPWPFVMGLHTRRGEGGGGGGGECVRGEGGRGGRKSKVEGKWAPPPPPSPSPPLLSKPPPSSPSSLSLGTSPPLCFL